MAILKCKMCGGTMEYDRTENLAFCPYCGNRNTVFEQDKKLFEQFQTMFAALLNQEMDEETEEGFWIEANREELIRDDGEVIEITYLTKRKMDLCTAYVARKNIIFIFESKYEGYAENYKKMIGEISYPNEAMERELSNYVPKLVTEGKLQDGRIYLVIEKKEGVYPLSMLGILIDRHVAWMVSRMENLCCLLEFNGIVSNGLTIDNLFVDVANHQLYLYGGWWFSGFEGKENQGASYDVEAYVEKKLVGRGRNLKNTDLESLRLVATKMLGYPSKNELKADKILPHAFKKFLLDSPEKTATKDFSRWDKTLTAAYGERKFIPLRITEEEIYSRR